MSADNLISLSPVAGWTFRSLPGGNLLLELETLDMPATGSFASLDQLRQAPRRTLRLSLTSAQAEELGAACGRSATATLQRERREAGSA